MSGNSDKEVEELPRLINLSTMSEFDNYHFARSTLISESFSLLPKSSKMNAKLRPYPPKVSFSSCQRILIKTFQIEGMIALITKMDFIFS